ncbi:MAG: nucleotidyltransferase domain-containing protein [archaeon]
MDNKYKIINWLGTKYPSEFTMHDLSKTLHIPYASFYRTVQEMGGLLTIKKVGKSKVLGLNLAHPTLRSHLAVAANEEKEEFLKNQPIIKKIATELNSDDIVLIFGSYAKGQQTDISDIDFLIMNKKGEKNLSFSKYELLFRKKINPLFITKSEFIRMLKDKEENVGKQALKDHIVLNKPETFWGLVVDGIQ